MHVWIDNNNKEHVVHVRVSVNNILYQYAVSHYRCVICPHNTSHASACVGVNHINIHIYIRHNNEHVRHRTTAHRVKINNDIINTYINCDNAAHNTRGKIICVQWRKRAKQRVQRKCEMGGNTCATMTGVTTPINATRKENHMGVTPVEWQTRRSDPRWVADSSKTGRKLRRKLRRKFACKFASQIACDFAVASWLPFSNYRKVFPEIQTLGDPHVLWHQISGSVVQGGKILVWIPMLWSIMLRSLVWKA